MTPAETILGVALVLFVLLYAIQTYRYKRHIRALQMPDDIGMLGDWSLRVHKQMVLPMNAEELALWDSFDESEKTRHVNSVRKQMLTRQVFYHVNDHGDLVFVNRQTAVALGIYDPKTKKAI